MKIKFLLLFISSVICFNSFGQVPNCATTTSPLNGITAVTTSGAVLRWSAPSGGGTVAGYLLFLGTDAAATNIVNGTSIGNVLTTTLGTLLCNQTYFWRVVPFNATGSATGCSISSFSTDLTSNTVSQSIYYPLNGNATDVSGNGRNGNLINSPTSATDRNGTANSSYFFNGTNQEIQPGYARIPAPASFTISLWFNTTATIGGKLIGFGNNNTSNSGPNDRHLYVSNAGILFFGVFPGAIQTVSFAGINDGKWHHVLASVGTVGGLSLYVDGNLVDRRASVTGAFTGYPSSNTGFWRIANDAISGSGWPQAPSGNFFNGYLDEIQIFNREMAQSELVPLMGGATYNAQGCLGSSLILSAVSIPGASSYSWSGPSSFSASTRVATVAGGVSAATAGVYSVTIGYGNSCSNLFTTTVVSNPVISNNSIAGSFIRCLTLPTTLSGSTPTGGDGSIYTYLWQSSITSSTSGFAPASGTNNGLNYSVPNSTNATWFRRIVYSGGCSDISSPVLVSQPLTASTITSWPKSVCVGETMNNNVFNANAVTGGGGGITYLWQFSSTSSTLGSSFVNLTSSNAQNFTPNVVLTATSWFRRVVTSNGLCSDTSSVVQVTVNSAAQGNPNNNGTGQWMVYGYNANNGGNYPNNSTTYSNYAGFYTVPGSLSFDTRTQWAPGQSTAVNGALSPSYTPGYQGCYINVDQHSYAVKGTNIVTSTGLYQVNIILNDDNVTFRLNNNLYYNTGWIGGVSVAGIYIGPISPSDIFEFTINEGGGGSGLAFQILPITSAPGPLVAGSITGADVICPGNIAGVLSNVTVPSGGCTNNFYTWQYSTDSTTWINLSNSNVASYTPVNSIFQKTWYRRVITDVCGQTAATLPVAINMLTPPGNSSVYGINMWNAYAFADQAWGAYAGQWTEPGLNFNSTVTYGSSAPPSNVINTTYQGCNIATNSYSTIYKRQGFPAGQYTIILTSDDYVDLRINGNMVYQNTGCLCGTTVAAWTGPLGPTDFIDFYHFNGPAGPGYLRAGFIPYLSSAGTLTGGVIGYDRQNCIGDVPVPLSNVTSSWAVMTAPNSATTVNWAQRDPLTNGCYVDPDGGYQWYQSNNASTWTLISGATAAIYSPTLSLTTTTYFIRVATDVCGATATSNFVTLTVGSVPVPTPTPTVGGTYGYGDGFWNVYGYGVQGLVPSGYIAFRNTNPSSLANYAGFYQDSTLYNFDTRNQWGAYSGPSAAVSYPSNYNGCTINTQLWAVWAKRTNIPAGTYQIDLGVDDDADLFINGTRVYVGQCCGVNVNSWTGNITTSTLIDIRGSNGNGPGWLSFTLTTVIPATSMYPGIVGNNQTICTGQVPATLTSLGVATSTCFVSGYQWQSGTSTTSWANIAGATTSSFTPTAAITVTSFFRRLAFDACGNTSTSNFVTVTVTPQITAGTAGISSNAFCANTAFTLSLNNPSGGTGSYGYQWQVSSTSTSSGFSNYTTGGCSGPFGAFLDLCNNGSAALANTTYFRAIFSSGSCSTVASNVLTVSVFTVPGIVTQPNNISVCTGSNVQAIVPMSAAGIGLSYVWQECNGSCGSGGWTNVANTANTTFTGTNTNILTITGIVGAMNGRLYRVVVNSSCGSVTSTSINMTTNQPPLVVTQPTSTTICGSGIVSFNPVASGTTLRYQWLASSVVGGPFTAVSNGVPSGVTYSGITTTSLNITTTGLTNYFYNLSIASSICNNSVTTNTVSITTNTVIGNNIMTVVSNLICNNATTTLLGSVPTGGNGTYTYQWIRSADDITFANATGGTSPTAQTYRPTPALTADTYFRRVVTSGVCTSTSTSNLISIISTPVFTTQPTSVTTCVGNTVLYTAVATSTGNVSYQWQVNTGTGYFNLSVNANYPSVTSSTLTVVSFPASFLGNQYRAVATASCTSVNSNGANLANFAAPTIDRQPVGSVSCSGGQIDVPYTVTGFQTALQWQTSTGAGWTNLSNFGTYGYQGTFGTAANRTQQALTFQITNPLISLNTSQYRVVLTGLCSNATSSSFTVTVQPAIANNGILISQNVCDGFPAGTITGSTPTGGSGTYTYNWLLSTGDIQSTTPGSILIGGNYFVTIPGANGRDLFPGSVMTTTSIYIREANSSNCAVSRTGLPYLTITVSSATVYVIEPTDAFVCNGTNALFTSSAVGSGITYKWQFRTSSTSSFIDLGSASSLPGFSGGGSFTVNNRNLTITSPPLSMNGFQFRGIAQGNCVPPYDTTQIVTLYMNPVPAIVTQPTSLAACANSTATFAVVATAAGALNYTWQISTSGTFVNTSTTNPYFGANTSALGVAVALNMNGHQFRSILSLGNCSVTTSGATLTTLSLAGITTQPIATTVCGGNTSTFSVVATGSGLNYQWLVSNNGGASYSYLLNDGTYSGTSSNILTITNTPSVLNGNTYAVLVTGTCNTVTSNGVNLGVYSLPTIITQPSNRLVCSGGNTTFITSASGLGIGYQWQLSTNSGSSWTNISNGGVYSQATTNTLSISGVSVGMLGYQYRALLTATCFPTVTSSSATLTAAFASTWNGSVNSDWFNVGNWCSQIPTSTSNVAIQSSATNMPVITTTGAICADIQIGTGASLTLNGSNSLSVFGSWRNDGTFTPNSGTVSFNGTGTQSISGSVNYSFNNLTINNSVAGAFLFSNASVTGTFTLGNASKFNTNSNAFTLVSTSTRTARMASVPSNASFVGNLTMQRYIPAKPTVRFMSSAVNGSTLQDWKNSIPVTGIGGSANGFDDSPVNLNSVWWFDETINAPTTYRFVAASNISMALTPGRGYRVYIRGDRTNIVPSNWSTYIPQPAVLSVTNTPNIGTISLPVSYTNYFAPFRDGTNLVGNPYPSEIDWDSPSGWTKTNIDNALYMFDPNLGLNGQYYYYVGGVASPARANPSIIPSSQGFLVKANAASPSLILNENAKVNVSHTGNFRASAADLNLVRIGVFEGNTFDESVLRFDASATDGFDANLDANKIYNSSLNVFTSIAKDYDLSINSLKPNKLSQAIPFTVYSNKKSTHRMLITKVGSLLDSMDVYLKDNYAGNYQLVSDSTWYTFVVNSDKSSQGTTRFELVTARKEVVTQLKDKFNVTPTLKVYPNPTYNEPTTLELYNLPSGKYSVEVLDAHGKVVLNSTFESSDSKYFATNLDFANVLPSGVYTLKVTSNIISEKQKLVIIK